MQQVFIYDENGFYLDSKFVNELGKNMTTEPILVGRIKPKFDTKLNEWVEGATEEEIKEWENKQPVFEPSEVDILKEKNSTLEKALLEMAEVQSKEYENRTILENAVLDLANTIAGGK